MATTTYTCTPTNGASGTGTEIRAWVQAVHDALAAIGMVQTADTGQVTISTMTNPAATATAAGYEVWRFDDTLQATAPVFFKVEYGRGYGTSAPQMWLTVGKGSDGAGEITGVLAPRVITGYASQVATAQSGLASSGDQAMCAVFPFAGAATTVQQWPGFLIDRSRSATGAPTGDGVLVAVNQALPDTSIPLKAGSTTLTGSLCIAANNTTETASIGAPPVIVPFSVNGVAIMSGQGLANGVVAPVFPWTMYAPALPPWQALAAISFAGSDDPTGQFTVRIAGADRTYRSIPLQNGCYGWGIGVDPTRQMNTAHYATNAVGLAILWE